MNMSILDLPLPKCWYGSWVLAILDFFQNRGKWTVFVVGYMLRSKLVLTEILTSGKKIGSAKDASFLSIGIVDAPANLKRWLITSSYHAYVFKRKLSSTPSPLRLNLKGFITVLCLLMSVCPSPPHSLVWRPPELVWRARFFFAPPWAIFAPPWDALRGAPS